jgi:ribose transport system permease protein
MDNEVLQKNKQIISPDLRNIFTVIIAIIVLGIISTFVQPKFFTLTNLVNILQQSVTIGIVAIGLTFVLTTGNIDLSPGAAAALIAVIVGKMMLAGLQPAWAVVVSLILGVIIGVINGFFVAHLKLASFIVTLSTMYITRSLAMVITRASIIYGLPDAFMNIGVGTLYGVPICVLILLILFILAFILFKKTVFGHHVTAIGSNSAAASLAGINNKWVIMKVFMLMGLLTGACSIILTGRVGGAMYNSAEGIEMQAIAGIVIGGTSMAGGKGNIWGSFFGVMLIAVLSNSLNMMGVSPYWTKFVQGSAILVSVVFDVLSKRSKS